MKKTYIIDGMHCNSCVTLNTNTLTDLPGVESVSIDLPSKTAVIEFDESQVEPKQIEDQVRKNGFQISELGETTGFFKKLFSK